MKFSSRKIYVIFSNSLPKYSDCFLTNFLTLVHVVSDPKKKKFMLFWFKGMEMLELSMKGYLQLM